MKTQTGIPGFEQWTSDLALTSEDVPMLQKAFELFDKVDFGYNIHRQELADYLGYNIEKTTSDGKVTNIIHAINRKCILYKIKSGNGYTKVNQYDDKMDILKANYYRGIKALTTANAIAKHLGLNTIQFTNLDDILTDEIDDQPKLAL